MPKFTSPLLAGNFDLKKAKFPYIATPKIDGIRFLMVDGVAVSRTFKPIRNRYVQECLGKYLPDGIDGELTVGDSFQSSTSGIMSIEGKPDFKVWIFDYVDPEDEEIAPYYVRMLSVPPIQAPFKFEILSGITLKTMEELVDYEQTCLENNFEGVMIRDPQGTYKFGRSTVNDGILLKLKRFEDAEALLIGLEEKLSNQNEATTDAFGHIKRSASMQGMIGAGTTGTLIVRSGDGSVFGIGSGLNDELRETIWKNPDKYIGKLVKYKFFPQGVKTLPRHPVFLGFRDPDDQ